MTSSDYAAFISYSHEDAKTATWLQGAIERYVVPKRLVGRETRAGTVPRKLGNCFRDRDELAASPDLKTEIIAAIDRCRFLVVICSPAAARSPWVDQEIESFVRVHGPDRIIAVITEGEPPDCFPAALRQGEPIAADLRPDKDGKRQVLLKVIAGMLGVGLDELVQREAQRRQRIYGWIATGTALASIAFAGLAVMAWQQRNIAIAATAKAAERRTQAEGLLEFMIEDLHEKLKSVGKLDVLEAVTQKALDYFSSLPPDEIDETAAGQKTRVLGLIGNLQTQRGQQTQAADTYQQAWDAAKSALAKAPNNANRLYEYARAVQNLGYNEYFHSDFRNASEHFSDALTYYDKALRLNDMPVWRREMGIGTKNLAVTFFRQMQFGAANRYFDQAEKIFADLHAEDPTNQTAISEYGDVLAWKADSRRWIGATREAIELRTRQIELYDQLLARTPDDREIAKLEVNARRGLALLKGDLRNYDAAYRDLVGVERDSDKIYNFDPKNTAQLIRLAAARFDLAQMAILTAKLDEAETIIRRANEDYERSVSAVQGTTVAIANLKAQADLTNAMMFNAKRQFERTAALALPAVAALQSAGQDDITNLSNRLLLVYAAAQVGDSGGLYQLIVDRIAQIPEPRSVLFDALLAEALPHLGRDGEANLQSVCRTDFRRIIKVDHCT